MYICVLSSGSCGNCTYVQSGDTGLLIDAGLSGRRIAELLDTIDVALESISAILVTHDHRDHVHGVGVLNRRFGIPVYVTRPTLRRAASMVRAKSMTDLRFFTSGEGFEVGEFRIDSIPIPHDASDPVGYVLECRNKRFGVFTDIGHPFAELRDLVSGVDVALLETNHDIDMLETGPYPVHLKRRISGEKGHLSNVEAARILADLPTERLHTVFLAHLSAENNHPDRVTEAMESALHPELRKRLRLIFTARNAPAPAITI